MERRSRVPGLTEMLISMAFNMELDSNYNRHRQEAFTKSNTRISPLKAKQSAMKQFSPDASKRPPSDVKGNSPAKGRGGYSKERGSPVLLTYSEPKIVIYNGNDAATKPLYQSSKSPKRWNKYAISSHNTKHPRNKTASPEGISKGNTKNTKKVRKDSTIVEESYNVRISADRSKSRRGFSIQPLVNGRPKSAQTGVIRSNFVKIENQETSSGRQKHISSKRTNQGGVSASENHTNKLPEDKVILNESSTESLLIPMLYESTDEPSSKIFSKKPMVSCSRALVQPLVKKSDKLLVDCSTPVKVDHYIPSRPSICEDSADFFKPMLIKIKGKKKEGKVSESIRKSEVETRIQTELNTFANNSTIPTNSNSHSPTNTMFIVRKMKLICPCEPAFEIKEEWTMHTEALVVVDQDSKERKDFADYRNPSGMLNNPISCPLPTRPNEKVKKISLGIPTLKVNRGLPQITIQVIPDSTENKCNTECANPFANSDSNVGSPDDQQLEKCDSPVGLTEKGQQPGPYSQILDSAAKHSGSLLVISKNNEEEKSPSEVSAAKNILVSPDDTGAMANKRSLPIDANTPDRRGRLNSGTMFLEVSSRKASNPSGPINLNHIISDSINHAADRSESRDNAFVRSLALSNLCEASAMGNPQPLSGQVTPTHTPQLSNKPREVNNMINTLGSHKLVGRSFTDYARSATGKVQIVYTNGDIYLGDIVGEVREGSGILTYSNGDVYTGEFRTDVPSGKGKYNFWMRDIYKGDFFNGKMHGVGTMNFADGTIYEGEFNNGKMNGKGHKIYPNGEKYEGEFVNNLAHGQGEYTFMCGAKYKGDFFEGHMTGVGAVTLPSGTIFSGKFVNGIPNGEGRKKLADGTSYKGNFVDGHFDGQGNLKFDQGSSYMGNFSKGVFSGQGLLFYKTGEMYIGNFVEGLFEGQGQLTRTCGGSYRGTFKKGLPEGLGVERYHPSEDYYKGSFKEGLRDGLGIYFHLSSKTYFIGQYKAGKRVSGKFLNDRGEEERETHEYDWEDMHKLLLEDSKRMSGTNQRLSLSLGRDVSTGELDFMGNNNLTNADSSIGATMKNIQGKNSNGEGETKSERVIPTPLKSLDHSASATALHHDLSAIKLPDKKEHGQHHESESSSVMSSDEDVRHAKSASQSPRKKARETWEKLSDPTLDPSADFDAMISFYLKNPIVSTVSSQIMDLLSKVLRVEE